VRLATSTDPERKPSEPESDPELATTDEADGQGAVNDTEARYGNNESPA
jgi:hypothetical protein